MAWSETVPSPTSKEKPTIAILKPHRDNWIGEYVETLWAPLRHYPVPWCNKNYFMSRVPSLPLSRNTLVVEGMKSNADFFLWVDSDHAPESPSNPNDALKMLYDCLINTGESVATGLYRAKQPHGFNYAIWKESTQPDGKIGFLHIDSWPEHVNWFQVDVCGLGFTLMRRKVFQDMIDAGYGTDGKPFFHWEHPSTMSEDFDFLCKIRKEFGYKIWCFSDVKLSHFGTLAVQTDGTIRVPRI